MYLGLLRNIDTPNPEPQTARVWQDGNPQQRSEKAGVTTEFDALVPATENSATTATPTCHPSTRPRPSPPQTAAATATAAGTALATTLRQRLLLLYHRILATMPVVSLCVFRCR